MTKDSLAPLQPLPRPLRFVLTAAGWMCVVLGIIGLAVPMMPGTVFLILAAACFTRSSPRFEAWLITHPRLGPPVTAWRLHGAITPRLKLIALASIVLSGGLLWASPTPWPAAAAVTLLLLGVSVFIVTRPPGPATPP